MYTLLQELKCAGADKPATDLAMVVEPLLSLAWRKQLDKLNPDHLSQETCTSSKGWLSM